MSDNTPRIDAVAATYYRRGKCICGKTTEREKTFRAATVERCQELAQEWMDQPIRHRRCEGK